VNYQVNYSVSSEVTFMNKCETSHHLHLGAIIFPRVDQSDFTGPFEVLSRIPDSSFHIVWKEKIPIRDIRGLILTPEKTFAETPQLDMLLVPGGPGQEALMEDDVVLSFVRSQAAKARYLFSVCTGALICGAAGLLQGIKATTHWSTFHLLRYFGAAPVDQRVVVDGKVVTAAGVTAGLDGALVIAALLRGEETAQQIQLGIEYAPEPPFHSGTPKTAPVEILESVKSLTSKLTETRLATARRIAARLGVNAP
jgi:cyclohexyl-isocyanide hydratase